MQWIDAKNNIRRAKDFHQSIANSYHANTYGFHGADPREASFEHVEWPEYVSGKGKRSHYELHAAKQDGGGDGTVPTSSGRAPASAANVKQWFALTGFAHEPAYKDDSARLAALYSIVKLTAQVREPKRGSA